MFETVLILIKSPSLGVFFFSLCASQAAKAVSQALSSMIGCLPGLRDVDAAIKAIANGSQKLVSGQVSALKTYEGQEGGTLFPYKLSVFSISCRGMFKRLPCNNVFCGCLDCGKPGFPKEEE